MFKRAHLLASRTIALVLAASCVVLMTAPVVYGQRKDVPSAERTMVDGGWSFNRVEHCLMRKINSARARHGLRRLSADKQLAFVARKHARGMAATGSIYHDGDMSREITRWRRLGQNTGRAGGCRRAFRAFMRSSIHRSNILGRWRFMGVGVERRGGRVFVQQVFESRVDPGNVYHYP